MSKYYQTVCALSTFITVTLSDCTTSNGCSSSATCDVEYVAERVYGCSGVWGNSMPGIASAEFLCADGYSICATMSWAETLGLTKELCLSNTLQTANYFYASLQSSSGSLTCSATGTDDVFGCASSDSDAFYTDTAAINCGPFGAQMSSYSVNAWKYGWEPYNDASSELTVTYHWYTKEESSAGANDWTYTTTAAGGVVCCIDELPVDDNGDMMGWNTTEIWFDATEMTDIESTQQYTTDETTEIVQETGTTDTDGEGDSVGRYTMSVLVAMVIAVVVIGAMV